MVTAQSRNFELQEQIIQVLDERPDWKRNLREMVEWERAHPTENEYDGWERTEVHTAPGIIAHLLNLAIINQRSKSRTYTNYRLQSVDDTAAALAAADETPASRAMASIDFDRLFEVVIGHDSAKRMLLMSLKAAGPVHCVLYGPPGSAKTLLIQDIGGLPGAEFYAGSNTTRSGLVGMLLAVKPAYLVLDEIDKMPEADTTPLLHLMETGIVTRLQHNIQQREKLDTKVFAAANDIRRVPAPLASRFAKIEVPGYTPDEFRRVAEAVLIQREQIGPKVAKLIATVVVKHSLDIRDAVRVARMCCGNPHEVEAVVTALFPANRANVRPIR